MIVLQSEAQPPSAGLLIGGLHRTREWRGDVAMDEGSTRPRQVQVGGEAMRQPGPQGPGSHHCQDLPLHDFHILGL